MEQLFIDAGYVRENLSPVVCIGLMEEVLKEQDDGSFVQYIRNQTVFPDSNTATEQDRNSFPVLDCKYP